MNAQELITAMETKGYWTSPSGKTPHATLYSAILRDLAKGDDSKFVKTESRTLYCSRLGDPAGETLLRFANGG